MNQGEGTPDSVPRDKGGNLRKRQTMPTWFDAYFTTSLTIQSIMNY